MGAIVPPSPGLPLWESFSSAYPTNVVPFFADTPLSGLVRRGGTIFGGLNSTTYTFGIQATIGKMFMVVSNWMSQAGEEVSSPEFPIIHTFVGCSTVGTFQSQITGSLGPIRAEDPSSVIISDVIADPGTAIVGVQIVIITASVASLAWETTASNPNLSLWDANSVPVYNSLMIVELDPAFVN